MSSLKKTAWYLVKNCYFNLCNKTFRQVIRTAQKMKFSIKGFFSKSFLRLWSHLLKKSLMEKCEFLIGSGPAPFFANLFLFYSESKWIKKVKRVRKTHKNCYFTPIFLEKTPLIPEM